MYLLEVFMARTLYPCKYHGDTPVVKQGLIHGFNVSWNPDTQRFHVEQPVQDFPGQWETRATFKAWRNVVLFTTHQLPR